MSIDKAALNAENMDFTAIYKLQEEKLQPFIQRLFKNSSFYREKLSQAGIKAEDIRTIKDLEKVPMTDKFELRNGYPLGLMAVSDEDVVRIHSSSGTTGKPIIVPYTQNDVVTWSEIMARCMAMAGVTKRDRVQITPGYGLWTAGIGFQAGVERLGAMAIPTGPGNTEKQLEMMVDLGTTVIIGTSSYALLLAEEIHRRGIADKIKLRLGIIGSERWSDKMRGRIEEYLKIDSFDIYGLTEIYGPGIAIDCPYHTGIHYWHDHLIFEVVDPATGKQMPPGEQGELVITTLTKEGMPLLRYRTHDVTKIFVEKCPCGSPYPMIDRILGRTDDMIKVKAVNIYPGQIDDVLKITPGACSEYQIILTRKDAKDQILIKFEAEPRSDMEQVAAECRKNIKARIGILADVEAVHRGALPRSEKKSKRVFDNRDV